jgi:hypothetical protein
MFPIKVTVLNELSTSCRAELRGGPAGELPVAPTYKGTKTSLE